MKGKIIIGVILLVMIGAVGGVYYRCFRQTICIVNSKIKFANRAYQINKGAISQFAMVNKPVKDLKAVWLWQNSDKPGYNKRQETAHKPLKIEIRHGTEGKGLSRKDGEEFRISVLGEDHQWFNKIILLVNPKYEDITDSEIGGAVALAIRWYIGSKNWPIDEEFRLIQAL